MHFDRVEFVRSALLPALWVFALPVVALGFGWYAQAGFDAMALHEITGSIRGDASLTPAAREEAIAFFTAWPTSAICADASPDLAAMRADLSALCGTHSQLTWLQRLAWGSIGLGLLTGLVIAGASAAAFASRALQLPAFLLGWNVLRVVSAVQTVAQGVILVLLSYWITAYFFQIYVVKLIGLAAILALAAVVSIIAAIFQRVDLVTEVEGRELTEADAPALWARVRELAAAVGTEPPDRIIGGIDDNFFVTEGDVAMNGVRGSGRTLFMSLALLRVLSRSEAEAVLAHEMAHFSGGDTTHSRRLAPSRVRYVHYLQTLHEGLLTLPVSFPMLAFHALFELASSRTSRERELRADAIAAAQTSADDIVRSLVKIGAFASYRGRVERSLFEEERRLEDPTIAERIRAGFETYARSEALALDLRTSEVPHPFDSHPPLEQRIAAVGCTLSPDDWEALLLEPNPGSWYDAIPVAPAVEPELWAVYEARFAGAHEFELAVRYLPETDEERAVVERHFPAREYPSSTGGDGARITFEGLSWEEWPTEARWEEVTGMTIDDGWTGKRLDVAMIGGTRSLPLKTLGANADELVALAGHYYGRHRACIEYRSSLQEAPAPEPVDA